MPNHRQDIVLAYGTLLDELGRFMDHAEHQLRPDQYRVLESTGTKLVAAIEGNMRQAGYLLDQYERMSGKSVGTSRPPPGPSGGRVIVPFRRRG